MSKKPFRGWGDYKNSKGLFIQTAFVIESLKFLWRWKKVKVLAKLTYFPSSSSKTLSPLSQFTKHLLRVCYVKMSPLSGVTNMKGTVCSFKAHYPVETDTYICIFLNQDNLVWEQKSFPLGIFLWPFKHGMMTPHLDTYNSLYWWQKMPITHQYPVSPPFFLVTEPEFYWDNTVYILE